MGIGFAVIIDFFDIGVGIFHGFELVDDLSEERLIIVNNLQGLHSFEERYLLFQLCLSLCHRVLGGCRRSFLLPRSPPLLQQLLILLIPDHKLAQPLSNRNPHLPPLLLIELPSLLTFTIIKKPNRRLNSERKVDVKVLKHDGPGCLFLLLVNGKRTTVEPKVGVYFLDELREDSALVVVGLAEVVGWAVEECVLFAGVAVEVQVHERSVLVMEFLCELFDQGNFGVLVPVCQ